MAEVGATVGSVKLAGDDAFRKSDFKRALSSYELIAPFLGPRWAELGKE